MIIMMTGAWYKLPSELLNDDTITKADCKVFAYIANAVKHTTKELKLSAIAEATELTDKQCRLSVKKLQAKHYIAVESTPGKPSRYTQLLIAKKYSDENEGDLILQALDIAIPEHERKAIRHELTRRHKTIKEG